MAKATWLQQERESNRSTYAISPENVIYCHGKRRSDAVLWRAQDVLKEVKKLAVILKQQPDTTKSVTHSYV